MNLLSRELSNEEIQKCINNNPDFNYDIMEGGYISKDFSVILIDNRKPYIGQLLQFTNNVDKEVLDLWVNKINNIVNM